MPRKGPRRELLAARIDPDDAEWVKQRATSDGAEHSEFVRNMVAFARNYMPARWKPHPDDLTTSALADAISSNPTSGGPALRPEDMSVRELEEERARLVAEEASLAAKWMVPDEDDEWGQVHSEIERVDKLLAVRRQQ